LREKNKKKEKKKKKKSFKKSKEKWEIKIQIEKGNKVQKANLKSRSKTAIDCCFLYKLSCLLLFNFPSFNGFVFNAPMKNYLAVTKPF
jgi:hypothetical protein